jgi:hypothetical protein
LVVADTHVRDDMSRIPDQIWQAAREADVILHAGDVLTPHLLDRLEALAPTHAVLGNNDVGLDDLLALTAVIELAGVMVAMIHDSGATRGRPERMCARFPDADIVIYGHSHRPDDSVGIDGQRLFNPGSCTTRRQAPFRSFGLLELDAGTIRDRCIVEIPHLT